MREGWEIKTLGEIATIYDHLRKPITKSDRKAGPYPYYGASGVQDHVEGYIFDGRYLLVGEDGAKWGRGDKSAYIVEGKCWVNNHAHILQLNGVKDTLVAYLFTFRDLGPYITGAIVPKMTQQALRSIPIPVPPIEEQEKIVAELDCLTDIIEKKRQQLEELDKLSQSIFYEMFGDPESSPFPVKTLGELSRTKLSYGSGASAIPYDGRLRYVRITDIDENGELNNDIVSPSEFDDKYLLQEGDLLFARSGATVGKTYLYRAADGDAIFAGYLIRVVPDTSVVKPKYLFSFTKTGYYKRFIALNAQAVAQPNINAKQYGSLRVVVPPLGLQNEFAKKIEAIEKQKELVKRSIVETETLFNSRMDFWFNN